MAINRRSRETPQKMACLISDGRDALSFELLNTRSARLARVLRDQGAQPGDRVSLLMANTVEYMVAVWACRRSGIRFVPINWHLISEEVAYVIDDSDSVIVIATADLAKLHSLPNFTGKRLVVGLQDTGKYAALDPLIEASAPIAEELECEGTAMFYSSGTTGKPKGILRPLPEVDFGETNVVEQVMMAMMFGFTADSSYLCPAPLYHAAPTAWTTGALALGGTAVILEQFDAEECLRAIERHQITHAQFVPTHFIRMLRLPEEVRNKYDLSSLKSVVHAAAPCPPAVKQAMIDWLGPIIGEYYAGSEGAGFTMIGSQDWLTHQGSVGRSVQGPVHIVGEDGQEMPTGEVGHIYFETEERFEYHKAPEKTDEFFNDKGWGSLGDMGYLDEEGFLYLADRKSHMIISGGVNIYPQEIENELLEHECVGDIAVIGIPNPEFGEEVKAVIQLRQGHQENENLAQAVLDFAREKLAGYKVPRSVDFVDELPRLPNGKLLKRQLRDRYWSDEGQRRI